MPSQITLTIPMDEYQEMQAALARAEQETADVRKQLEAAKFVGADERVAKVTAFARDCLEIARFAVANLSPETIRGWPHEVLARVADAMEHLPDYSLHDRDMAVDLKAFARECKTLEDQRKRVDRVEIEKVTQVVAGSNPNPIV